MTSFWILFIAAHVLAMGIVHLSRALALVVQTGAAWAVLSIFGATIPVWMVLSAVGVSFLYGLLAGSDRHLFLKNLLVSGALAVAGASYSGLALPMILALGLHAVVLYSGMALVGFGRTSMRPAGPFVIALFVLASVAGFSVAASSILPSVRGYTSAFGIGALPTLVLKPTDSVALEPIDVGPGVGWESKGGLGSGSCALLLHGANGLGSLQPASKALIVALHKSGYRVLALDHLGYGRSPSPSGDSLPDWNPARITDAGVQHLQSSECSRTVVVGHSMGVAEALRLARRSTFDFEMAFLFGGGLLDRSQDRLAYWHGRFHSDRRLSRSIPFEDWYAIDKEYYRPEAFVEPMSGSAPGPAIVFVEFKNEHEDLASTRDMLKQLIGTPQSVSFPTNHYFNARGNEQRVLLDARSIQELSTLFADK